jgi:phosphoglycerate dehydrogenase-like enzyme
MAISEELSFGHDDRRRIYEYVERHGSVGPDEVRAALGLDELDATFTTAAGVHARPLAEFVVWAMLAFAKNYPLARKQQREHRWERFHNDDLSQATLAVVGLGGVGREVARLASALGARVVGSKRTVAGIDAADMGVDELFPMTALHDMLGQADYVCLIAPHTAETENMIDEAAFTAMKPSSVLINIGRGALVDEQALLYALREGQIRGAVLDVAPKEPLPPEHPLWDMEHVILFPHSASTSRHENSRLTDLFIDNLQRFLTGESLRNRFENHRLY